MTEEEVMKGGNFMTSSPNHIGARIVYIASFPNCLITTIFFSTPFHNHVIAKNFVITPSHIHVFHKTVFITSLAEPWGCSLLDSTLLLFHPITPLHPAHHSVTDLHEDF
jgi:hypothetical protein